MTQARRWLIAASAIVAGLVGLSLLARSPELADESRHVVSRVTSLARYGPDEDSIWVYITSRRDIRIRADGSGEIAEQFLERRFPSSEEKQQWLASAQEGYGGVNQAFGPGELFYILSSDVRAGVTDPAISLAPAGDALRRLASLLGETAPTEEVRQAAMTKALGLDGVQVERSDSQVIISGVTGDGGLKITLAFEAKSASLVSEVREALIARPGLQVDLPYLVFERAILLSETIANY